MPLARPQAARDFACQVEDEEARFAGRPNGGGAGLDVQEGHLAEALVFSEGRRDEVVVGIAAGAHLDAAPLLDVRRVRGSRSEPRSPRTLRPRPGLRSSRFLWPPIPDFPGDCPHRVCGSRRFQSSSSPTSRGPRWRPGVGRQPGRSPSLARTGIRSLLTFPPESSAGPEAMTVSPSWLGCPPGAEGGARGRAVRADDVTPARE